MADKEALLKEYKQLAKRADQRLVRLEKVSQQEHYKGATSYAYARAMRDIKQWSGDGASRFNTKAPSSVQQLQAKINDIKTFLDSPTSTKSGITSVYKKRTDTINSKYGTSFTWKDLANYYESGTAEKLDSKYGSKTLIKALGAIKKSGLTPEDIESVTNKNKKLSNDDIVNDVALRLISQGYTADNLFN